MTQVYYSYTTVPDKNPVPDCAWEEPVLLVKDLVESYSKFPTYHRLLKCPSLRDSLKNTYVIKSPLDLNIQWDESSIPWAGWDTDTDGLAFSIKLYPHLELLINNQPLFIANKSVTMRVLPPFMHENAPRYPFLGGQFDVGKWYRPVHPTFLMHRGEPLYIKRGDALMYVQFDQNVKLKRFRYTDDLHYELKHITDTRQFISIKTMKDVYNWFAQSKRKKFVLDEIKKNLL